MGRNNAEGMAAAVSGGFFDLREALDWHLRHNHYPPLPVEYIDVAEKAIEILSVEHGSGYAEPVLIPDVGVTPRDSFVVEGETFCHAGVLADIMHLWPFIEEEE